MALIIGTWMRLVLDDSYRVTGGSSTGVVPQDELARLRLEIAKEPRLEVAVRENRALIFGVQYHDLNGDQMGWSEVRVNLGNDGRWTSGRTELFRAGDTEPYAFGL